MYINGFFFQLCREDDDDYLQVQSKYQALECSGRMPEVSLKYSPLMEMEVEDEDETFLVTFFTAFMPPKLIFIVEKEAVMLTKTCAVCSPNSPNSRAPDSGRRLTKIEQLYAVIERFKAELEALEAAARPEVEECTVKYSTRPYGTVQQERGQKQ